MIRHNLHVILRTFIRYKSTFLVNLVGLSTGLTCTLLIYLWVRNERSVDTFNENDDQFFQVMKTFGNADGSVTTLEETPTMLANFMKEDFPEVEHSVSTIGRSPGILSHGETRMKARPQYVDTSFFKVFSYRLEKGSISTVLSEKYGVVLSDKMAMKLFNTTEVLGKTVDWQSDYKEINGAFTVTGVFISPPANATLQFDILFSYSIYFDTYKDLFGMLYWGSNTSHTFLMLKNGTDTYEFNKKLAGYSKSKYKMLHGTNRWENEGEIFIQRYSSRYLYGKYENGVVTGGRIEYVRLFFIIGVFVIAIACINFMNLSTAHAIRRIKEIGIKKAIGVGRKYLALQYLFESAVMVFIAMTVAIVMVILVLPAFNEISNTNIALILDSDLIFSGLVLMIVVALLSGSYPALYLSSLNPVVILKGRVTSSLSESLIRKGLVVFQFVISIVLILSVFVVHEQVSFIQSKNLGYNRDNVMMFTNEGPLSSRVETFLAEVRKTPGVMGASSMGGDLFGHYGGGGGVEWEGKLPGQGLEFGAIYAGDELFELLELELKEGRIFSSDFTAEEHNVIFNETAITAMGLKDPVGKIVRMWGENKKIIGIVKDFNFESMYNTIKPFFFRITRHREGNRNLLVKIEHGREHQVIGKVQHLYQSFNDGLPLDYRFMDEDYQKLYASELRVALLSKYFAGITILISCLGLLGLAAFTAERRSKEIGIRKVLGGSVASIVYLLSGEVTKIVVVAIAIALPAGYLIDQSWLNGFAFRIELSVWYFIGAGGLALTIAWITVGWRAMAAARANPARTLRAE